jgi:hypothetical protein
MFDAHVIVLMCRRVYRVDVLSWCADVFCVHVHDCIVVSMIGLMLC